MSFENNQTASSASFGAHLYNTNTHKYLAEINVDKAYENENVVVAFRAYDFVNKKKKKARYFDQNGPITEENYDI